MYDFANILFAGPCNARCPACIGKQVDARLSVNNLDVFPLHNLESFIAMIQEHGIRQVVFTGTTTDPQLYRHEGRLVDYLRQRLGEEVSFSLHTNGRLALGKIEVINLYERVCISFPSFDPFNYRRMMGVAGPPDLEAIIKRARAAIKISCLVTEDNAHEVGIVLQRCHELGIRRMVFRKLFGDRWPWSSWIDTQSLGLRLVGEYRGNPVYGYDGMEVTLWDFDQTESRSINLFSSGEISSSYHLVKARPADDGRSVREGQRSAQAASQSQWLQSPGRAW